MQMQQLMFILMSNKTESTIMLITPILIMIIFNNYKNIYDYIRNIIHLQTNVICTEYAASLALDSHHTTWVNRGIVPEIYGIMYATSQIKNTKSLSQAQYNIYNNESIIIYNTINNNTINIYDNLYYSISLYDINTNDGKSTIHKYNIIVYYKGSRTEYDNLINKFIEDYNKSLKIKKAVTKKIYTITDIKKPSHVNDNIFEIKTTEFTSFKTFNNIYFKDKDILLKHLESFHNVDSIYKKLGMPHTFGLLLSGEPGTGKTSIIKAIVNKYNKVIINVPMSLIKTKTNLMNIFYTLYYGKDLIPYDNRVYLFEEIDCNGWDDIVKKREYIVEKKLKTDSLKTDIANATYEDNDALTLGAILEIIDGLVEFQGRMIIMTTNHPEVLDPALLRAGRIDMHIHMGKLRREDIGAIYKDWTGKSIKDISRIPNERYTQADIGQLIFKYKNSPDKFIRHLEIN